MGLFGSIKDAFSTSSSGLADYWNVLDEPSQVAAVVDASEKLPQLIYKHSHRCSTCFFARQQVEKVAEAVGKQADLHFVDVIAHRPVSKAIADKVGVRHESPQLLVLYKGKAGWHASHGQIQTEAVLRQLNHNIDGPD